MESQRIQNIVADQFDQFTFENDKPVIVLFSADRCSACKSITPSLEQIAENYENELRVFWVDVDQQELLVKRFRLKGIPTLLLFKDGEIKDRINGVHSRKELLEIFQARFNIG